jgi:hypothetical protein
MLIGFLLNIITIFIWIVFRFGPKFKMGLQLGMIMEVCILVIPYFFVIQE